VATSDTSSLTVWRMKLLIVGALVVPSTWATTLPWRAMAPTTPVLGGIRLPIFPRFACVVLPRFPRCAFVELPPT
jgi:hypothetical protein